MYGSSCCEKCSPPTTLAWPPTQKKDCRLINCLAHACREFGLPISLKKTNVMGQDVSEAPSISVGDYTLEVVEDFSCLGSTTYINMSLDAEINKPIGKAASAKYRLSSRVWENTKLTANTNISGDNTCVLSTLLYGSETRSAYARQKSRFNSFHLRCLRSILGISWHDRVPNKDVLERANIPTMCAMLSSRRWVSLFRRVEDGRLPN